MIKRIALTLFFLAVFIPTTNLSLAQTEAPSATNNISHKRVTAIEIEGNKTISMATILSKIKTRVGQEYIQSVISDDLKRLYNTGYFNDVRVDRKEHEGGFKVTFFLEEKPIVEEVTFSRIRNFRPRALAKKLKTQEGKFLDRKDLKDDVETIEELYMQKGLTNVDVEVETFVDEVTNKASLHFVITEGQKIRIRDINFYGNTAFSDKKLRSVVKSREKFWFFRRGYLKEDVVTEDVERLRAFYEQNGYIDANVSYDIEKLSQGFINLNFEINEGRRYSVGSITITGNKIISDREIRRIMENIEEGGIFSRDKLSIDLSNIRTLYFDRGYIFANVEESTRLDPNTGKVDITINIAEGDIAYIDQVKIQGNTRTRDIVIRRELRLYPGDRFDGSKLRRSRQRLEDLGYFEDISFDIEETDVYDRRNLIVQVKEAKTGTFSFGGGYSTVDQLVGFIEVEQRNFDFTNWPTFTGGGQHLVFRAETGSVRNNIRLSFTEPWIFDHPISGGFDAYRSDRERDDDVGYAYDEERVGGVLRFGKRFNDEFSVGTSYKYEVVDIGNFEPGVSSALLAEGGKNKVSTLGFTATIDKRNSRSLPSRGYILTGGTDVAGGFFGGDKDFYRFQTSGSYYIPFKWDSVVELSLRAGIVNDFGDSTNVPIFERFFAGGARTIRGYEERGVGPLDSATLDPIGGEAMLVGNIEYTIPLVEFLKLAFFVDSGNVWAEMEDFGSGGFKTGTGIGLRVKTPIGPINLDYGYPLNDEPGEEDRDGKFYFSVSRGF